jgi:hypothetical protein
MIATEPVRCEQLIPRTDRIVWRGFILPVKTIARNVGLPFPAESIWWTIGFEPVAFGSPTEIILGDTDPVHRVMGKPPRCVRCPAVRAVAVADGFPFCLGCFTAAVQNGDDTPANGRRRNP